MESIGESLMSCLALKPDFRASSLVSLLFIWLPWELVSVELPKGAFDRHCFLLLRDSLLSWPEGLQECDLVYAGSYLAFFPQDLSADTLYMQSHSVVLIPVSGTRRSHLGVKGLPSLSQEKVDIPLCVNRERMTNQ